MSDVRRACSICDQERGTVINAFLAAGRSAAWIEREMRNLGSPVKGETVRKHLRECLNGKPTNAGLRTAAEGGSVSDNPDFASAVRAEATRLLQAGKLQISASHGLKAQELIDRRAERAADRELMVQLAGLLSGAVSADPGPPEDLIEGEWTEVTPTLALAE